MGGAVPGASYDVAAVIDKGFVKGRSSTSFAIAGLVGQKKTTDLKQAPFDLAPRFWAGSW